MTYPVIDRRARRRGAMYGGLSVVLFSPLSLFASGEQGAWYDPSDMSTLWQDSARTTPVTSDGDPVGAIDDKSGNGNHATQSTSAARPTYHTDGTLHWLSFDGVDDYLLISATFTSDMDSSLGFFRADSSNVVILRGSSNTYHVGVLSSSSGLPHNASGSPTYAVNGNLVSPTTRAQLDAALAANSSGVLEINGADMAAWGGVVTIGNFSGYHISGNIYSVVLAEGLTSVETNEVRNYLAKKSGVPL